MQPRRKLQLLNKNAVSLCPSRYSLPFHFMSEAFTVRSRRRPILLTKRNMRKEKEIGFCLQKSKGQHLLVNPRVLHNILRVAVRPTDTVLEIGPGIGNLTIKLLEACRRVVAIEIDLRTVDVLLQRDCRSRSPAEVDGYTEGRIEVEFPPFDIVVANILYGISSPLISNCCTGKVDSEVLPYFCSMSLLGGCKISMENGMDKDCLVDGCRVNQNISNKGDREEGTEDCLPAPAVELEISLFREKITGVLGSCGFEDKRPSKLSNGNLLHLPGLSCRSLFQ